MTTNRYVTVEMLLEVLEAGYSSMGGGDFANAIAKQRALSAPAAEQRAKQAERERDEARIKERDTFNRCTRLELRAEAAVRRQEQAERWLGEARVELAKVEAHVCTDNTPVIAALQAELAALKAQEPVCLVKTWPNGSHEAVGMAFVGSQYVREHGHAPVYAAPVPQKFMLESCISTEQHERLLAEARRSERERCAKVCEGIENHNGRMGRNWRMVDLHDHAAEVAAECRDAIRTLQDQEVGE